MPFPSLQVSSSSTQCYQLAGRLSGEANRVINCLTINDQGTFLASGAMWITPKGEARETLCFGMSLSYLIFWRQSTSSLAQFEEVIVKQVGTGCEITCMACGTSTVAGLNVTVPKDITFVTRQDDLYVWGMYDGEIGGVALHDKQLVFTINTVTDSFSLHSVETRNLIQSTRPTVCKPKQVAFGEKGSVIIGGGESGVVYIFDRKTNNPIQILCHANEGLIQTIVVCDGERETTIVAGTSNIATEPTISIWRHACCSPAGEHCAWALVMLISEALNCSPPIQSLTAAVSNIFGGTSSSNETSGAAAVPELMCLTTEKKKWYLKL
ncbi:hypothetical protein BDN67DRAFT_984694 [Paxillus ammoniavirescens]|nr:hypothetical protein BDN67DRAFT_984694 [Paxillus ammoniavirescens]